VTFKASAHHLSFNELDDRIKLIRRKVPNGSEAVAAVKAGRDPEPSGLKMQLPNAPTPEKFQNIEIASQPLSTCLMLEDKQYAFQFTSGMALPNEAFYLSTSPW
jgi:hypothetical protein